MAHCCPEPKDQVVFSKIRRSPNRNEALWRERKGLGGLALRLGMRFRGRLSPRTGIELQGQQLQTPPCGKGLHAVRELSHQPFENGTAALEIAAVLNLPCRSKAEPVRPFGIRTIRHVQKQLD